MTREQLAARLAKVEALAERGATAAERATAAGIARKLRAELGPVAPEPLPRHLQPLCGYASFGEILRDPAFHAWCASQGYGQVEALTFGDRAAVDAGEEVVRVPRPTVGPASRVGWRRGF